MSAGGTRGRRGRPAACGNVCGAVFSLQTSPGEAQTTPCAADGAVSGRGGRGQQQSWGAVREWCWSKPHTLHCCSSEQGPVRLNLQKKPFYLCSPSGVSNVVILSGFSQNLTPEKRKGMLRNP